LPEAGIPIEMAVHSEELSDGRDVRAVAICPVCGRTNEVGVASCGSCLARMGGAAVVSVEEAEELARRRDRERIRRRAVRWGVAALVVLAVGAWIAYENIGTTRFLPPPASTISADPANGDWPMFMRDAGHSAVAPVPDRPLEGRLKWRFDTGEPIVSSPAIVGERVFLSTGDRRVVVVDAETGRPVWERPVSGPVNSSPAVAGGLVFVGLRDGTTVAMDRETGDVRWERRADGLEYSSPAVLDGVLYIGSGDRMLYALDAVNGDLRWTYEATDMIVADPVVNGEIVAVTSEDGVLHIVDVATGNRRLDVAMRATGAPVLLDDLVYVADRRGVLVAVDWHQRIMPFEKGFRWLRTQLWAWGMFGSPPVTKGIAWAFLDLDRRFVGSPVLANGRLYVATKTGQVVAIEQEERETAWEFDAGAPMVASPTVVGDLVLVGDSVGTLHALDASSGDKLWEIQTGKGIVSTPVFAHGTAYVTSLDGSLYAIE
jgi:outer membrane protein assembly factor BamB